MDSEALEVVGRLYAAATGEEGWDECLCRLADFCGATNAALVRADLRAGNSSVIAPRADPAVIAAYTGQWWVEDPTSRATANAPVGQITSLADTGHELFHKSLFHNEFWRHSGLGAERLAVNLSLGRERFASCVLQTSAVRDELDARSRRRFACLVPHLVRAEAIHGRLHRLTLENAVLSGFGDRPRAGLIVVDAALRVLFADDAGEARLAEDAGLRLRGFVVGLDNPRASASLQRAVAACVAKRPDLTSEREIQCTRGGNHTPLSIEVLPWAAGLPALDFAATRPAAILLLHDRRRAPDAAPGPVRDTDPPPSPRSRSPAALHAALTADIAANLDDCDVSLAWLAARHGLTPRRIRDLFYARNTSFTDYLLNARLERARDMLRDGARVHVNVAAIALDCGFGDISWFHHAFRRRFRQTPAQMRRQARTAVAPVK
ncbi:MAG TPA: helix-turn-helix transcriptional regulator [Paracoccus sp.]|nr:helix-turn-helix transcriptional regulator [Paracoccus sp. (in: a-proteobacteria)]